jgi:hypothetical protein
MSVNAGDGYTKAALLLEILEKRGIIGPPESTT